MRVTLNGHYYQVLTKVPWDPDSAGMIDLKAKEIRIKPGLDDRRFIITLLHECLHAELPDHDEDAVGRIAYNLGVILHRLGATLEYDPVP